MNLFTKIKYIKNKFKSYFVIPIDIPVQSLVSSDSHNIEKDQNIVINSSQEADLSLLLEKAFPSENGLYPHEILMLYYAPNYTINLDNNYYQSFWNDKYYVVNPSFILETLMKRGFISKGDIRQTIEKLTILELKEELKSMKEKTTGNKQELVDRIMLKSGGILEQKYPIRYFQLTSLGEQELQENQYVPYLHKNNFMSIWDINKMINKEHKNYRDCIWEYFNKQSLKETSNYNFSIYSNIRFNMGRFLIDENKHNEALYFFCETFKYDNSLLGNSGKYFFEEQNEKMLLAMLEAETISFFECIIQAPELMKYFTNIYVKQNFSEQMFQELLLKNFNKIKIEFCMFTDEELVKIIEYEMKHRNKDLQSLYNYAKKREKQKINYLKEKLDCNDLNWANMLKEKYGL